MFFLLGDASRGALPRLEEISLAPGPVWGASRRRGEKKGGRGHRLCVVCLHQKKGKAKKNEVT